MASCQLTSCFLRWSVVKEKDMPDVDTTFMPQSGILAGSELRYLVAGQGAPVVLLHGVGGFKELWWGTMRALAPRFRAWAFDWPGHGSPPLAPDVPVLEELARRTVAACAELGLDRIALVGHSLGGNVAARVALAQPWLVQRLALIDAAVDAAHMPLSGRVYAHPRWKAQTARVHAHATRWMGRWGEGVPHTEHGNALRSWARRCSYMARQDEAVLQAFVGALYRGSLGDELRRIQQPTLVLTGARDLLVRPAQARRLAQAIPNARLVILPGAYHNPMDEQPTAFEQVLVEFLAERE
jgi:3-oxoadipate enol-lactonase